jgi:hypothetical protein
MILELNMSLNRNLTYEDVSLAENLVPRIWYKKLYKTTYNERKQHGSRMQGQGFNKKKIHVSHFVPYFIFNMTINF